MPNYFSSIDSIILKAFLLFVLYVVIAKAADVFIDKVLRRLVKITKSELDDKLIDISHRPVFITILILGSVNAIRIMSPPASVVFYSSGFLYSLLVFIWGTCVIRISNLTIKSHVHKVADITGLSREVIPLIENVLKIVVIVAGMMVILSIWKINVTPLLASAGIAGVAVALAAKDTLANFFGGISIFMDRPYKISDFIVLDGGERGEVVEIGIRSTRIKTRDDILISIPNSILANTKIINESAPIPNFRIRIPASVAYGSDIEKVEEILLGIADDNDYILKEPKPRVRFREFGESSLNFQLLCWTKEPVLRGRAIHEVNKAIYHKFNEAGVNIPFPHRTVYLREEKEWKP